MPKTKTVNTKVANAKLEGLQSTIDDLRSKLARALADYANLERRFAKDSAGVIQFANASLLEKLLDVRDHLAAACVHLKDQSLGLILQNFDKVLAEEGVTTVNTDGPYDPATMECQETAPGEKDKVISVIRLGYMLRSRLLRPARVVVGSGVPETPTSQKN